MNTRYLLMLVSGIALVISAFVYYPNDSPNSLDAPHEPTFLAPVSDSEEVPVKEYSREKNVMAHEQGFREISIVAKNGASTELASVYLWDASNDVVSNKTDSAGKVSVEHDLDIKGACVVIEGSAPYFFQFENGDDSLVLTLDSDESLWGNVRLHSSEIFSDSLNFMCSVTTFPTHIPEGVIAKLKRLGVTPQSGSVVPNNNGAFVFDNVGTDWRGTFSMPNEFWICEATGIVEMVFGYVELRHSSAPIDIVLHRAEKLYGEVLLEGSRERVAKGRLVATPVFPNSLSNQSEYGAHIKDGYFSIPMTPSTDEQRQLWCVSGAQGCPSFIDLQVFATADYASKSFEFETQYKLDPWDLGTLILREHELSTVRAVNQQGQPIVGAMVLSEHFSKTTDDTGWAEASLGQVVIAARGYKTVGVRIEPFMPVAEVVLKPSSTVVVDWSRINHANMHQPMLRLVSEGPVIAEVDGVSPFASIRGLAELGMRPSSRSRDSASGRTTILFPALSHLTQQTLWGLSISHPIQVCLVDSSGAVVSSTELIDLKVGVERRVDLVAVPLLD